MIDSASLGFAGRPTKVNIGLLNAIMRSGNLPVISPVAYDARNPEGGALNVNGDDAAAALAVALGAEELLLIADVDGVQDENGNMMPLLNIEMAQHLLDTGTASQGMAAKLEAAQGALLSGVESVRICDLAGLVDGERGTFITQSQGVAI
jgi:acetylglutamate kinase